MDKANLDFYCRLMEEPAAYGKLGLAKLLELREECLREFQFMDAYITIKQRLLVFSNFGIRENEASLAVLADLLIELDSMNEEDRLLALIEGVLAANIFDWGSRACVDLYHKGTIIEIYRMSRKKMQRPWRVNYQAYEDIPSLQVVLIANSLPALNDVTALELPEIVAEAAKVGVN
ncbi:hypothetical protein B296_00051072 [Ensete ventricosum]|uniref:Uncharacterized protein n=1 Tax=Ensete ventricosum TaxID=4639 RepID=A0A426YEH1_ENSVE|nr:hypothetical protein B296_00051072 [Ensete ventricosum]